MTTNMKPGFRRMIFISLTVPYVACGQGIFSPPDYQSTMISNPALTGSEGNGLVRLSYINNYPGNSFNLHTALLSYDGYFPSIHGGAGFYLSDNYLGGIINDLRGGLSYSYFLQAGKDLFFSAGLSAAFCHRGFNYSDAILPDQIDPLAGVVSPSGETLLPGGRTVFDISTGFLFISGNLFGGISISHLTQPDISGSEFADASFRRSIMMHIAGDIGINREKNILLRPVGRFEVQKGLFSGGAGAVLETSHLSFNSILFFDNHQNFDTQAGFTMTISGLILNYNYHFNIISGKNLLPLSVLHEAGIAIGLNDVDKRKTVKTINFPKL